METKSPINIFIVDDNKVFSLLMKSDLENNFKDKSIEIQLFETGEACMQKFMEEKPSVVILDYHLNTKYPDAADGIEVLDWIKKKNNETFVIMMTTNDNIDIAIKSFQHGAADYVVKTDTKFKKIAFSLLNYIKIMEAKNDSINYQRELNKYLNKTKI